MMTKKLLRDLMENKIQFLSIFLMSFLGIFIFVGIDSEVTGLKGCEERYYTECSLADLWVRGRDFSLEDLAKINDLYGVKKAERRLEAEGKAILKSESLGDDPKMTMHFLEEGNLSSVFISEGQRFSPGRSGVWIDAPFAKKRGLKVGDKLTLKLDDTEFTEQIEGLFYHPEFVYNVENAASVMPSYGRYGVAVMDISGYPGDDRSFNTLLVDASGIDNLGDLEAGEQSVAGRLDLKIKEVLDDKDLVITGKSDLLSYETFSGELKQHRSMSVAFPIVFILISLLGIITTMSRLLARQRIQIGTLKALGFSTGSIIFHYCSYGFVLSLAGSLLGAFAGYHSLPAYIIGMFTDTYILPYMTKGFSPMSFVMIILEVSVSTYITWRSSKRECALIPAQALRPASPKLMKPSAIEKSPLWDRLGFSARWNIRDIMRNKLRSFMGAAGAAGCAMLIFSALGCMDSLGFITGWMYGEINTAKTRIVMKEGTPYGVSEDYAKEYEGQMVQNAAITITGPKRMKRSLFSGAVTRGKAGSKNGTLTVIDSGNYIHFQDEHRKHISLGRDEAALSYRMAQLLDVKKGDIITWRIQGEEDEFRVRVGQIYRNPSAQGLTMYRESFERTDHRFTPDEILTNMTVPASLSDDENITEVQDTEDMMSSMDDMMTMMYSMAAILILAAVVLAVVVLYNLGVLSLLEKTREMATLKVLGLGTKTIRGILQQQNVVITVFGVGFGYFAGSGILKMMFSDMPDSTDYCIVVNPQTYVVTFLFTLFISMLVNHILSASVNKIDMATALKGQE